MQLSIEEAVRNSVEAEESAARFYSALSYHSTQKPAKEFFAQMAEEEWDHARSILAFGKKLGAGQLPANVDVGFVSAETMPGWEDQTGLTYGQAIEMALSNERHSELVYASLAETAVGEVKVLFNRLVGDERRHALMLEEIMAASTQQERDITVSFKNGPS